MSARSEAPDAQQAGIGPETSFEGGNRAELDSLPADARFECRICWLVYDPAEGDSVWQVPAGTPFAALPAHWRCPQCDAPAAQFLLLERQ